MPDFPRRATGRPRKKVDATLVEALAKIMASRAEIAAIVGCSVATLDRRFDGAIKSGHEHAKASLRRRQFEVAMSGNCSMLIWLGKQYLNQTDKAETATRDRTIEELITQDAAAEEVRARILAKVERLTAPLALAPEPEGPTTLEPRWKVNHA